MVYNFIELKMPKINKRGLELSINTIIILIIAIVFLGIVLGFVTGVFGDLTTRLKGFPTLEIEPTAKEPITFIPSVIERGKENKMTIGFYNNEQADLSASVLLQIKCEGISAVAIKSSGLSIPVGSWKNYAALISVPADTPSGQHSCTMTISKSEKTFFMEVK